MTPAPTVDAVMDLAPVIPVLVIDRVEDAVPVARALVAGGLRALEVTLRTPVALEVIRAMTGVEGAVVGAGTVLNMEQLDAVLEAGARFVVSPGLTPSLGREAVASGVPFLPGVANAADIMTGLDLGLSRFKFFPAMAAGGLPALKALAAPFHQARFCPTGGINAVNAAEWLAQPFVGCVGGSWIVPKGPVDEAAITAAARTACALRG